MPSTRNRYIAASLVSMLVLAGCSTLNAVGALLGNEVGFTAAQLQGYLDRRFPQDYEKMGGMVTLSVLNPRVAIPPNSDRLHLDFDVGVGGLGSDSRTPSGHFSVTSGVRFDTATRGLHLDAPALESVDMPALGGVLNSTGRGLINRWLQDYARSEPVYQLDASLLEKLGSRRIASTTIDDGRIVVHLDD